MDSRNIDNLDSFQVIGGFREMTFKPNEENKEIMEFHADNSNLYMNKTADDHFAVCPIKAPCLTIQYRDFKGNTHIVEGVLSMFISDYKGES